MTPDAELLRRYAESRSEEAFAELVQRHLNLVYFAALRRAGGNGALAEDIAQGVFTALAQQAGSLSEHAALTGWLYTTTRNTAAKAAREPVSMAPSDMLSIQKRSAGLSTVSVSDRTSNTAFRARSAATTSESCAPWTDSPPTVRIRRRGT